MVLLHYGDLSRDLDGEMRRLADRLGIDVAEPTWPELVEAATFDRMRQRSADLVPDERLGIMKDTGRFFRRGTSGGWRDVLTDDDRPVRRAGRRARTTRPRRLAAPREKLLSPALLHRATIVHMTREVSVRQLRNETAHVVRAVEAGEEVVLTANRRPVADIVPHRRRPDPWVPAPLVRRLVDESAADHDLLEELAVVRADRLGHG